MDATLHSLKIRTDDSKLKLRKTTSRQTRREISGVQPQLKSSNDSLVQALRNASDSHSNRAGTCTRGNK